MRVYVITKNFKTALREGASPVAVVLDKAGVKRPYNAEEFTLIGGEKQIPAAVAFNEVSKLSPAARQQLGFGAEEMAILEREAADGVAVKAGETAFVDVYRGIDGMDEPTARGVYTYDPKRDPYTTYEQFTVAETLKDHFRREKGRPAEAEISELSPETLKYLKQRGPKHG